MGARPRLFDFNNERDRIIRDATERVYQQHVAQSESDASRGLEYLLNEAAFREIERLSKYGPDDEIGEVGSFGFWRTLARRVGSAGEGEKRRVLKRLARSYMTDIAGNFDPKVYQFANQVLPVGLSMLFNAQGASVPGSRFQRLRDRIQIEGDLDTLRALSQRGTLIVAPTHLSNLDSPVIGWALKEAGLPPVTYGAGKNLFTNRLLSYFMHNLGAYRVDRRINHQVYKSCLKAYSEVLLERGFHSLFFPGGTRSRSGAVEDRLKLGLLGTGLTAYVHGLSSGRTDKRLFVVPMTLNCSLVLEAEGLINDYMRAVGREFFLLPDDPFDSPLEVARFVTKVATMQSSMVIRLGEPMDILGHAVDAEGVSHDSQGRPIQLETFFEGADGSYVLSRARDRIYTRQAGEALVEAYVRNTVIMPTQFLSYVLFEAARRHFPDLDLVRVLRFGQDLHVPWDEVNAEAGRLQEVLRKAVRQGRIRALHSVLDKNVPELVDEALVGLNVYHAKTPVEATGQGIRLGNMELLCYYGNRLRALEELR